MLALLAEWLLCCACDILDKITVAQITTDDKQGITITSNF